MNGTSPDLINDAILHQQLNDRHLSYRGLFRRLDKNQNERIDVKQLVHLLEKVDVGTSIQKRWDIVRVSAACAMQTEGGEGSCSFHSSVSLRRPVDHPTPRFCRLTNSLTMSYSKRENSAWFSEN